jgi:hypothetical protein
MDENVWLTTNDWVGLWHSIPWGEESDRKRRLIATAVCRHLSDQLSDSKFLQFLEISESVVDRPINDRKEWDAACDSLEMGSSSLILNAAVEQAIWTLRSDDHKVGRAIEAAADVFGYIAAIREGVIPAHTSLRSAEASWTHPVFVNGRDNEGGEVISRIIREVVINPFRPITFSSSWLTSSVDSIAKNMYGTRVFTGMPILADALQEAGCEDKEILIHCRNSSANHIRGCWVLDLLLNK